MPVYDDYYDANKKLTIYIDENDPDFEYIEVIRLGTDEHKIFKKEYQITGYIKDDKSFELNECCKYTSEIVPHIDECIYLPHKGLYQVSKVI